MPASYASPYDFYRNLGLSHSPTMAMEPARVPVRRRQAFPDMGLPATPENITAGMPRDLAEFLSFDPSAPQPTMPSLPPDPVDYAPQYSPADVEARISRLTQQGTQEGLAANPGLREYNAASLARGGRPPTTEELGQMPWEQAQHNQTTIGGSWGDAFGDLTRDRGVPGAAPRSINSVPLMDLLTSAPSAQPVSVMGASGGTKNIYPGAAGEPTFGGDTVVRKVGGKNTFVDKNPAPQQDWSNLPNANRRGSDDLRTYLYDAAGEMQRDDFGNPMKDPEVAAARAQYLADQNATAKEDQATGKRDYKLKQMGMRAMPLPEYLTQPAAGGVPLAALMQMDPKLAAQIATQQAEQGRLGLGQQELGMKERLAQQELQSRQQEGAANRTSQKEIAQINAGGNTKPTPEQAARLAGALKQLEQDGGDIDAYNQNVQGIFSPPGATPAPQVLSGTGASVVPNWAREGGMLKGPPLEGDKLVAAGRAAGKSDAEISAVLKQVTGNSYADAQDPNGIGITDMIAGHVINPLAIAGYHGPDILKGKMPRLPILRLLGIQ